MKRTLLMLKSFAPSLIKFPALGAFGVVVAAIFLLGSAPQAEHPNASLSGFTSFDAPGAGTTVNALQGTAAFGINASGEIVGIQTDSKGVHHGIVRTADGTITQFDAPGAGTYGNQGTLAAGIDTAGDVTGYYTDAQQAQHGYVRTANGTLTVFDVPGGLTTGYNKGTNAIGINDSGTVVGQFAQGIGYQNGPFVHGFLRTASGSYTTFDAPNAGAQPNTGTTAVAINATGVIAGYSGDPKDVFHGFVRAADGTLTQFDAPGAGTGHYQGTISTAINASGEITGVYLDASGAAHGFLRSSGGLIITFDAPGAGSAMLQGTFPLGINSAGEIVGFDFDSKYLIHAFTRAASNGTLTTIDAPGAGTSTGTSGNLQQFQGTGAFGINDSGAIAGSYLDTSSVTHGFVVAAPAVVPASFAVAATAVSLSRGATTGNTSTITVTPAGGFTGAVAMTAAVTANPFGAQDPPTVSFGTTTPVNITGAAAGTATLTISTTAATSASLTNPRQRELRWYGAGGAVLACILFFGVPARRRGWVSLLSLLLFFAAIGGGILGCSGSGSNTAPMGPLNPGTTPGNYVVTVTGTSGTTTSTATVALTVQ